MAPACPLDAGSGRRREVTASGAGGNALAVLRPGAGLSPPVGLRNTPLWNTADVPRAMNRPTAFVCMLRAVNVGRTTIKMDRLRALFADMGYTDVSTYIQSGNVLFTSTAGRSADHAAAIERRIAEDIGVSVSALIRSGPELARVVTANPFVAEGADPAELHVTFLPEAPEPAVVSALEVPDVAPEEFRIVGREVYLHLPGGYGTTKLSNAFWERRLRTAATTRNWRTVTTLYQRAEGDARA
jgi:uncharacterized protein (DUF1697 family)